MPDPTPSDATNLLLSFLAGGLATDTAETVRNVRGSKGSRPPIAGLDDVWDGTLGTMLDGLFAVLAAVGELTIREDDWARQVEGMGWKKADKSRALQENLRIGYATLSIRKNWLGWQTDVSVAQRDTSWAFGCSFAAALPENNALLSEKDPERALELLRSQNVVQPNRVTTETVGYPTLAGLAACLNGDATAAGEALSWKSHVSVSEQTLFGDPAVYVNIRSGNVKVITPHPGGREALWEENSRRTQTPEFQEKLRRVTEAAERRDRRRRGRR